MSRSRARSAAARRSSFTCREALSRRRRRRTINPALLESARGETILVVEDDADLRTLAVLLLTDLGYRVLEAGNGKVALKMLELEDRIDLLLTDVVLPDNMGGKDIADAIRARLPMAKVLYMSGYADSAIADHGPLDPDARLLPKPFDPNDLAEQVRMAIDA